MKGRSSLCRLALILYTCLLKNEKRRENLMDEKNLVHFILYGCYGELKNFQDVFSIFLLFRLLCEKEGLKKLGGILDKMDYLSLLDVLAFEEEEKLEFSLEDILFLIEKMKEIEKVDEIHSSLFLLAKFSKNVEGEEKKIFVKNGAIEATVRWLRNQKTRTMATKIIANLCYHCKLAQDQVREKDGILPLLENCKMDETDECTQTQKKYSHSHNFSCSRMVNLRSSKLMRWKRRKSRIH